MTGELTVRRKTGVVRPSLLLLHLVSDEDPFARALCGTRPRSKRGEGWSAPLDESPTCRVCAGKRWLSENRRTNGGVATFAVASRRLSSLASRGCSAVQKAMRSARDRPNGTEPRLATCSCRTLPSRRWVSMRLAYSRRAVARSGQHRSGTISRKATLRRDHATTMPGESHLGPCPIRAR